jgi:hypothetical protein
MAMTCAAAGRKGGQIGGKAKVAKGFASPAVQAKAHRTRERNRKRAKSV